MSATQEILRFGVFELNLDTEELRKSGVIAKLPPQPFRLLALLASHAGQIVTRDEIQKQLWGELTEVDSEHGTRQCINQIRTALGENSENPVYVETIPRQGYRFLAPVVSRTVAAPRPQVKQGSDSGMVDDIASRVLAKVAAGVAVASTGPGADARAAPATIAGSQASKNPAIRESSWRMTRGRLIVAFIVSVALLAAVFYWRANRATELTEKDTIVIAEFDNKTGDPVFDSTLRQGLSSQLEQSPFLNLLSDRRIAETLSLMAQPKDAQLTKELAREVCQRTASAATIEGFISTLGSQYVLGLEAIDCRNGDLLASEQITARGKEQVLKALGSAATKLRRKLGESLASVQKYDALADNATTPSLEALQAYSLAYQAMVVRSDYPAANPLFMRAISLDPNFAMAYARLGMNYGNLGETTRAAENIGKAYELRDRVSEREKFYIESHYEQLVSGNLEAARKTCELWAQTYPRDPIPPDSLSYIYTSLGDYDNALAAAQKRLELAPGSALSYGNLVIRYMNLNRLDEAMDTAKKAQEHNLDAPLVRLNLYLLHFLQRDEVGMEREFVGLMGKEGQARQILYLASDTAAYAGQFSKARALTRRAADSARHADDKEAAAEYVAEAAVREALVGNGGSAKQQAQAALNSSNGKNVEAISAIALALAGDSVQAARLAGDLAKRFPVDTVVQVNYLPTIYGATALRSGNPGKAVAALASAAPYELGGGAPYSAGIANFSLHPVYQRGTAYLAERQGAAAIAEFQKILDHPGIVLNEPIGALAHLGRARAYSLSGDTLKAKSAYRDFFTLWKEADPDIPIFKQAKAEYARLR